MEEKEIEEVQPLAPTSKRPIIIALVVIAVIVIATALWWFVLKKEVTPTALPKEEGTQPVSENVTEQPTEQPLQNYTMTLVATEHYELRNIVEWVVTNVSRADVNISDVNWKLIDPSTGDETSYDWRYYDNDGNGCVSPGDKLVMQALQDGDYIFQAIYQGSIAFESAVTHY
ncbi:MAG: hypothetical protein AB1485_07360 [Candidatus Thermoplasmatota archaeon]